MMPSRRCLLGALLLPALLASTARRALAATLLSFNDLYSGVSPLGLIFSAKLQGERGHSVTMRGFMAPPLKAEARFFVLTEKPMALCPFCSSDADWPDNIVVVYLSRPQTFVQYNAPITVTGTLEVGSWRDPDTEFLSLVRLVDASFHAV